MANGAIPACSNQAREWSSLFVQSGLSRAPNSIVKTPPPLAPDPLAGGAAIIFSAPSRSKGRRAHRTRWNQEDDQRGRKILIRPPIGSSVVVCPSRNQFVPSFVSRTPSRLNRDGAAAPPLWLGVCSGVRLCRVNERLGRAGTKLWEKSGRDCN
jgi:hypothetical protein